MLLSYKLKSKRTKTQREKKKYIGSNLSDLYSQLTHYSHLTCLAAIFNGPLKGGNCPNVKQTVFPSAQSENG